MADRSPEDIAKARLWILTLVRLAGFALVMGGLWVSARQPFGAQSPIAAGLGLFGGVAMMLLLPPMLARRWRQGR